MEQKLQSSLSLPPKNEMLLETSSSVIIEGWFYDDVSFYRFGLSETNFMLGEFTNHATR